LLFESKKEKKNKKKETHLDTGSFQILNFLLDGKGNLIACLKPGSQNMQDTIRTKDFKTLASY